MVLNQATDYAMRISLFLAKQKDGCVNDAASIRSEELIPKRFLFKIMRSLIKAGIVKSIRGKNGGFMLGRNPVDISVNDIIEAVEGPIVLNNCLLDSTRCNKDATGHCVVHIELKKLREELVHKFQGINLEMLLEKNHTVS